MFHLKPPSVTVESVITKKTFGCRVSVNLDKFIFQNNNDYTAKRDAIRETYLLFGNALGIARELGNLLSGAAGMNEQPLTLQPPVPEALTKIQYQCLAHIFFIVLFIRTCEIMHCLSLLDYLKHW